jgi:hypothetical protein
MLGNICDLHVQGVLLAWDVLLSVTGMALALVVSLLSFQGLLNAIGSRTFSMIRWTGQIGSLKDLSFAHLLERAGKSCTILQVPVILRPSLLSLPTTRPRTY